MTKQTKLPKAHIIITGDNGPMTQQSLDRALLSLDITRVFVAGTTTGDFAAIQWCVENSIQCLVIPPKSARRGGNTALLLAAMQGGKSLRHGIIAMPSASNATKRTADLLSQARTSYSEDTWQIWDRSNEKPVIKTA